MPAPYRLAIFDFDGTLADTYDLFAQTYDELAVRHGFRRLGPEEARELRGLHPREVMKHVGMPAWKLPAVAKDYIAAMRERRAEVRLFSGIADTLASLRQAGVTIAVVSANAEDNVRAVLGDSADHVRHYACGMSIFGKRSHLAKVLRLARIPPAAAIYIGDQAADHDAAREAGIDFGAVSWGFGEAAHLESLSPSVVFRRVEEIATCISLTR